MNKNKFSTKYLVEMALLVAIILLMAFTPIGYIKTAGLEITLIVVPVAVGAVTLGPTAGAILGGVFGITSFIQCFGMSQFGALLLGINPFLTFLVCVPTRILMGWLTGLIYQGKMPQSVRERYMKMKENPEHPANLDALIKNFDCALSHPDSDDLEKLRNLCRLR
jgi:uncharacterized membrane protein